MNWPAHPRYKSAGVEWLDQIPVDWNMQKLRRVTTLTTGWTPPSGDHCSYDGDNPWANISDLGPRVLEMPAKRISDDAIRTSRIPMSPRGSLLFSFKLSVGQVSFAGTDMYTNEAIATFTDSEELDLGFAYYSFPYTLVKNANENIYGAKLLNQELMYGSRIPLPNVDEQRAIARFLDRETAKIDALIDKQEQLIATLLEDRSATISAAITSGIDNKGQLPAGRGEESSTPAHWSETKIRHVARLNPSMKRAIEKLADDELVTFVPMDSIGEDGSIDVNRSRPLSEVRSGYSFFERDDVLMAKVTPCFENGKLALAANLPHPCGFATTEVTVLRPTRAVYGQFLCYLLRSQTFRRASIAEMTGAGGLRRVPDNQVRNFRFRRPPLPEQRVIVQFLDDHCLKIDSLIAKSTEMIDTLREYRSALITNAVTGKIDVREAV